MRNNIMEECLNKNLPKELKEKYKTEEFYNNIIVDDRIPKDVIEIIKKEYERNLPVDITDPILKQSFVDRYERYREEFQDDQEVTEPCIYWEEGKDKNTNAYTVKLKKVDEGFIPVKRSMEKLKEYAENGDAVSYNNQYEELLLNLQDKKHYLHLCINHFAYLNYSTLEFILDLHKQNKTAKTVKKHNITRDILTYLDCIRHNELKWLACIEYSNKITEIIKSLALKYGEWVDLGDY